MALRKCVLCEKGKLVKKKTSFSYLKEKIVMQDIPCEECNNCGEKYFDLKACALIDEKRGQALKAIKTVPEIKSVCV